MATVMAKVHVATITLAVMIRRFISIPHLFC
jgi:hypothetical protein